jgi:hypothetical protein
MGNRLELPIHGAFDSATDAKRSPYGRLHTRIAHQLGDPGIPQGFEETLAQCVHASGRSSADD